MKMRFIFVMLILSCISIVLYGCSDTYKDVVRIHIRANSNEMCDQDVKYVVRDSIVEYITPLIIDAKNVVEVKNILENNIPGIEDTANTVLVAQGYEYRATATIKYEYFPTRVYGEYSFPADYYDALVINLGTGTGDNWWCVAYPPLCFVGNGSGDVVYKSKILEIIDRYF